MNVVSDSLVSTLGGARLASPLAGAQRWTLTGFLHGCSKACSVCLLFFIFHSLLRGCDQRAAGFLQAWEWWLSVCGWRECCAKCRDLSKMLWFCFVFLFRFLCHETLNNCCHNLKISVLSQWAGSYEILFIDCFISLVVLLVDMCIRIVCFITCFPPLKLL